MAGNGCTIIRMWCHGTIRQCLGAGHLKWLMLATGKQRKRESGCLSVLTVLPAFPACVCILKFPWAYACLCTVNTYERVFLCVSVSLPPTPPPVCRHAAASSTVIKLSWRRGIALSSSGSCFPLTPKTIITPPFW